MRSIRFAEAVAQDLEEIYDFIAADNVQAADRVIARLQERWRGLVSKPGIGTKRDELREGIRSVTEGNYLVFYQATPEEIEIVRVLHTSRDIPGIFGTSGTGS